MRDHPPSACASPESQLHATIQISVTKYLPIHAIFFVAGYIYSFIPKLQNRLQLQNSSISAFTFPIKYNNS